MLLLALAVVAGSLGAFVLLDQAEPWHLVGGLGSAVYITAGILLFPRLGALVTVGLFIAGQMLASLALDGFGWLGVAHVTSVFLLIPQLGAAPVVALTVGGQQVASVAVDRYGWLRLARRDTSLRRLLGVAVLLTGVTVLTLA